MNEEDLTYPSALRRKTPGLLEGTAPSALQLGGWQITDRSLVLGHGAECFRDATQQLLSWQAHAFAGVRVEQRGTIVQLKFGPTSSRCLILEQIQEHNRTVLVYGTLPGHVERGEEAFAIEMASDGAVTGRCVAFSRPAWIWARIGKPVARRVQLYITDKYLQGMKPVRA